MKARGLIFNTLAWFMLVLFLLSILAIFKDARLKNHILTAHGSSHLIETDSSFGDIDVDCRSEAILVLSDLNEFLGGFDKLVIHNDSSLRRGLSNGKYIKIRCINDKSEYRSVLIHEIAHVVDISYLNGAGNDLSGFDDFGVPVLADDPSVEFYNISWLSNSDHLPGVSKYDFVSEYAASDPFEDFAESFLMYYRHGEVFRYLAYTQDNDRLKRKYEFIRDEVFGGREFNKGKQMSFGALYLLNFEYSPVFDMTKLFNLV